MKEKISTPSVVIFMRSVDSGQWSIERVFNDVVDAFESPNVEILSAPYRSTGLLNRLRIIVWAYRNQRAVNHIAGDIHFATFLLPRKRTILTVHDLERLSHFSGFKRWLLKTVWFSIPTRKAGVVTVISQQTCDDLAREVPAVDASSIRVIHNPVSPAFVPSTRPFDPENPRVLQVGTRKNKNLDRVIEALHGVKATLVILGDLSESHRSRMIELDIPHEVHTALSHDEVVELYAGCDLVVFASLFEGFGLPAIEAQASAKPLVTSVGQPFDDVVGTSAIRVDPHDVADIRQGILEIINNPSTRSRLVRDGLRNAGRFSAQAIAAQYLEVYREILPDLK